eukprot:XP_014772166.1 PREDICTED: tRNA dimethylallyltransferase, mitochondrial-like [Octopus bimaculoides]
MDGDSSDSESSHSDRTELKGSCTDNIDVNDTVSDSHKEYCTRETTNISECDITSFPLCDIRQWGYEVDTVQLHAKLKELDPTSAQKIHPNDRRKLIRALEIYDKHGIPKSEILKEQHKPVGLDAISGPLRYPKSCIFWIQCDQEVLNKRLDKRVDDMLQRGLVNELLDFHKQYNESRIKEGTELDYTLGIFQSIGFKEFHEYLILSEEERNTKKGEQLFNEVSLQTCELCDPASLWLRYRDNLAEDFKRQAQLLYPDMEGISDKVYNRALIDIENRIAVHILITANLFASF